MTITNGYATLSDWKNHQDATSVDYADDSVVEVLIEAASRLIDNETRRTFYARTATNKYDVPDGNVLYIEDDDLLTITKLMNGDGTTLTTNDYILKPNNSSPKWAVQLKSSSTVSWETDSSGNSEQAISIEGTWGWSATAPADIKEACLQIATNYYKRRFGENAGTDSTITVDGIVVTAKDIPASAKAVIANYTRLV